MFDAGKMINGVFSKAILYLLISDLLSIDVP